MTPTSRVRCFNISGALLGFQIDRLIFQNSTEFRVRFLWLLFLSLYCPFLNMRDIVHWLYFRDLGVFDGLIGEITLL